MKCTPAFIITQNIVQNNKIKLRMRIWTNFQLYSTQLMVKCFQGCCLQFFIDDFIVVVVQQQLPVSFIMRSTSIGYLKSGILNLKIYMFIIRNAYLQNHMGYGYLLLISLYKILYLTLILNQCSYIIIKHKVANIGNQKYNIS